MRGQNSGSGKRKGRSNTELTQEEKYLKYSRYAADQREKAGRRIKRNQIEVQQEDLSRERARQSEIVMAERIRARIDQAQQEAAKQNRSESSTAAEAVPDNANAKAQEMRLADAVEQHQEMPEKAKENGQKKKERKKVKEKPEKEAGAARKNRMMNAALTVLVMLALATAGIWYLAVMRSVSVSDIFSSRLPSIIGEEISSAFSHASAKKSSSGDDAGEEIEGFEDMTETETQESETGPDHIAFAPVCAMSTLPSNLIEYTELQYNGEVIPAEDFTPWYHMDFGYGEEYSDLEGVIGFRGNNFRDDPMYGSAVLTEHKVEKVWSADTGGLSYGSSTWTGSGWTGQPLIMKWPRETKAAMNMYDWAKADDELVEVIYACMDGYIYFFDLKTGKNTRDAMYLGYTFKGAGALDPRGYPIMYVGAGYDSYEGKARVFVINLIDCSVMYTFGNNDEFNLRGNLSFFDSSALVDAASDTLIYPGESGILYLIHLNTSYDQKAGTLSIDPDKTLKWHYYGTRSSGNSFWLGMEDSAAVYGGYLFVADNGGNLMCLNLNTMQLEWTQDILDDSNSTPVLSVENGHLYLYVSTSFRLGWRGYNTATVPVWKIDANNGEIVWQHDYTCYTMDGVSGGVQSTIALGKGDLEGNIYVTVSMTDSYYAGVLACLDRVSGDTVWEHHANYAWSSPVCVRNADGADDVIYCDSAGNMYMLDGLTGDVHDTISLSDGVIEASPAVYENYAVVGTRACKIWGLELK